MSIPSFTIKNIKLILRKMVKANKKVLLSLLTVGVISNLQSN